MLLNDAYLAMLFFASVNRQIEISLASPRLGVASKPDLEQPIRTCDGGRCVAMCATMFTAISIQFDP